jgi:hypothetical protein
MSRFLLEHAAGVRVAEVLAAPTATIRGSSTSVGLQLYEDLGAGRGYAPAFLLGFRGRSVFSNSRRNENAKRPLRSADSRVGAG